MQLKSKKIYRSNEDFLRLFIVIPLDFLITVIYPNKLPIALKGKFLQYLAVIVFVVDYISSRQTINYIAVYHGFRLFSSIFKKTKI